MNSYSRIRYSARNITTETITAVASNANGVKSTVTVTVIHVPSRHKHH